MKAVLSMATFAGGGITEWLDCDLQEFTEWISCAKELNDANS
jgi:hypothetical protein